MIVQQDVAWALGTAVALTVPVVAARAATAGGAVAGFLHAAWFAWAGGLEVILAFMALVVLGVAATRAGRATKERFGAAQGSGGRRAARHVAANATPAAVLLLAGMLVGDCAGLARAAACAALAGSLADTVAGEIGMLSPETPRTLLVGRPVARGADGGMTCLGLLVSVATAACVGGIVAATGAPTFWPVFAGGVTGSVADSILGATIERTGVIGNEGVNFSASASAGLAGWTVAWMGGA
jgi:uncharacterized protein (TIGR00297 family)